MYYRAQNELIVKGPRGDDGSTTSEFVERGHKKAMWGKLNYLIGAEVAKNDLRTRWKDRHAHTVNDAFNYCPMILNYIASRGFQRVLFVGHFNAAQRSWTFPRSSDRNLYATPSYHSANDTMVDPHIWLQFLPIVHASYRYRNQMHVLVPPESRHRQLMHALYRRYELNLLPCTRQYKYGRNFEMTPLNKFKYDCVVFAGVPKDEEGHAFTIDMIEDQLAPYCANNFTVIDLNYQDPDANKFIGGATRDNRETLHEVFSIRGVWDESYRSASAEDRQIEYKTLDNIITEYRGPRSMG